MLYGLATHHIDFNFLNLKPQNDGPDETQDETGIAIDNVLSTNGLQAYLCVAEKRHQALHYSIPSSFYGFLLEFPSGFPSGAVGGGVGNKPLLGLPREFFHNAEAEADIQTGSAPAQVTHYQVEVLDPRQVHMGHRRALDICIYV